MQYGYEKFICSERALSHKRRLYSSKNLVCKRPSRFILFNILQRGKSKKAKFGSRANCCRAATGGCAPAPRPLLKVSNGHFFLLIRIPHESHPPFLQRPVPPVLPVVASSSTEVVCACRFLVLFCVLLVYQANSTHSPFCLARCT
jgi:hypothetical protein